MSRGLKFSQGGYIAVSKNGYVVEGYKSGPKLYVNPRVARKYADFGGRVFHVWEDEEGVHIDQVFE